MKKYFVLIVVSLILTLSTFGMESGEYMFKILNEEAATETVAFSEESNDIIGFESLTNLHFQMQQAVYETKGHIEDNTIVDYQLSLFFNDNEVIIHCSLNEDILSYTANNISNDIQVEQPLLILDNNLAWSWQLVYNLYRFSGYETINVFVPQLLLRDFTDILKLEIQKTTESEGHTNVFFSYNDQSGMLKVDENDQVIQLLMGGTMMERTK
ncbi:MAG: hypothetical protein ACLFQE_06075 [Thermotogota bacterium]